MNARDRVWAERLRERHARTSDHDVVNVLFEVPGRWLFLPVSLELLNAPAERSIVNRELTRAARKEIGLPDTRRLELAGTVRRLGEFSVVGAREVEV